MIRITENTLRAPRYLLAALLVSLLLERLLDEQDGRAPHGDAGALGRGDVRALRVEPLCDWKSSEIERDV